jgi:hypothetical protein
MSLGAHVLWAAQFLKAADKKSFRIVDSKSPKNAENVDISILPDQPGLDGSTAETPGWVVDVRYSNAPDVVLFNKSYIDESTARKVMDDLSMVAGEVEGFLRQEDFEKAQEATKKFLDKLHANSGQSPVTPEAK